MLFANPENIFNHLPVIVIGGRWFDRGTSLKRLLVVSFVILQTSLALTVGLGHYIFRSTDSLPDGVDPASELATIIPHTHLGSEQ